MKKDSLLKMKDLPATEEMLAVAREDVQVKVGSGWNTSYRCRYSGFVRSAVACGVEIPGQLILFHAHIPGHGTSPKWFSIT